MRPLEGIKILDCPHVPAARVRELREALADPHLKTRGAAAIRRHRLTPRRVGPPRSLRPGPGLR